MGRSAMLAMLISMSFTGAPALAQQGPMSPIFRTTPNTSEPISVSKAIAVAPVPAITMPPATAKPERDDPAVATAVIPPPPILREPPAAKPEPAEKPRAARPGVEKEAAAQPTVKRPKRAARPSRFARRYYAPYYGYANYGYATAAVTGWGGGRFGPSPNASSGQ